MNSNIRLEIIKSRTKGEGLEAPPVWGWSGLGDPQDLSQDRGKQPKLPSFVGNLLN